jgi:hypothetical protein
LQCAYISILEQTEITLNSIFSKQKSRLVGVANAAEAGGALPPVDPANTGMSFRILNSR